MTGKPAPVHPELPADKLQWRCDPARVPFATTDEFAPMEGVIGQERALRALKMGVELSAPGYNIFVCGLAGTSRGGMIVRLIEEIHPRADLAPDRCYVNNFKNLDRPRLLTLPRGSANTFKKDMNAGIDFLKRRIPQVFEGEPFQRQKTRIVERFTAREKELMDEFTRRIGRDQFALGRMQVGAVALPEIFPVLEGQMVPIEEVPKLVQEGKIENAMAEDLERKYDQFRQEFTVVYRKTLTLSRELASEMSYLEQEAASVLVDGVIQELKEKYPGDKIAEYLNEVHNHILDNLEPFKERDGEENPAEGTSGDSSGLRSTPQERDPFRVYSVNVILDHGEHDSFPVIFETAPSYANLFGAIHRSYDSRGGGWSSDFMDLRAGSLLRADGGYLIMYALDALSEPGVWRSLKRTLNHSKLELQPPEAFFPFGPPAMKPEPIDMNVKIVLIGDRHMYELLYEYEEDFRKIFKVRAEFDEEMVMSDEVLLQYGGRLRKLQDDEGLCPFDRTAVARMIEFGVRLAGRRNKVTARFSELLDLARESCYMARQVGEGPVSAKHVRQAIEMRTDRHNLLETKIREMIEDGVLLIDVDGVRAGQVNGLSVMEIGGYAFGKPSRITASTALGKAGIINIEREANLSGRFHDKGVQIISGYMRGKFAKDKPLTLSASLCFEQSYSGVDGDSASSTEIYALLSALSGLPLRQDIAVTGSVNQQGQVQAIGGVNQKIEGFFATCRVKGLTGRQGVMIPHENVEDLMLNEEVIDAVKQGKFHIYAVRTIEQGIEILTGVAAGSRDGDGSAAASPAPVLNSAGASVPSTAYPPDSVFGMVDARLRDMARLMKEFD